MSVRVDRLAPVLRACLQCVADDNRGALLVHVGRLAQFMSMLYVSPVSSDSRGNRVIDHGAGDAMLYARQLRASVAELPVHSGLGGIVFDGGWIVGMLDNLMILLER